MVTKLWKVHAKLGHGWLGCVLLHADSWIAADWVSVGPVTHSALGLMVFVGRFCLIWKSARAVFVRGVEVFPTGCD